MFPTTGRLFLVALSLTAAIGTIVTADEKAVLQQRWLQDVTTDEVIGFNETEGLIDHNETEHHAEEEGHVDEHHDEVENHNEDEHDHDHGHEEHSEHAAASNSSSKPWGEAILASLLINIVTLVGVFFLSGEHFAKHVLKRDISQSPYYLAFTRNIIPSFACGALLATTVFLMLPEALHLISAQFGGGHDHRLLAEEEEESGEGQAAWRFGVCIIAGFLLPTLTDLIFPNNHEVSENFRPVQVAEVLDDESPKEMVSEADVSETAENSKVDNGTAITMSKAIGSDLVVTVDDKALAHAIDWSLAASVLAGDFFHNFAGMLSI